MAHVNHIQQSRLWLYLSDLGRIAYCAFSEDWKGSHSCGVLEGFSGDVHGDGYGGINALFSGSLPPTRVGCHDDARRTFVETLKMGDNRAQDFVALRQAHAVPIWQQIDQ